jgi:hypothetical protein
VRIRRAASIVALVSLGQPLAAHHSFAPHFDSTKPISITGTVKEFEARNPHAYLHIETVDSAGTKQVYVCESHGVTQLRRNGIGPARLLPGVAVTVEGVRARRDEHMCFFQRIRIGGGPMLSVNGPDRRRTGDAAPAPTARPETGIFGKWLLVPANRSTSGPNPMMGYLTQEGRRAVDAYDPFVDDPTFRCDPVAVRRVWFAPSTPLEISRTGEKIILRHEWMDVERVVHLDVGEHPLDGPRSSLGHSIGHFEDGKLIIETSNYAPGVLRQYVEQPDGSMKGLLHSDALTSTEVLRFDDESQTLVVTIELRDPKFFTRDFPPVSASYVHTDLEIEPFGCIPEASG